MLETFQFRGFMELFLVVAILFGFFALALYIYKRGTSPSMKKAYERENNALDQVKADEKKIIKTYHKIRDKQKKGKEFMSAVIQKADEVFAGFNEIATPEAIMQHKDFLKEKVKTIKELVHVLKQEKDALKSWNKLIDEDMKYLQRTRIHLKELKAAEEVEELALAEETKNHQEAGEIEMAQAEEALVKEEEHAEAETEQTLRGVRMLLSAMAPHKARLEELYGEVDTQVNLMEQKLGKVLKDLNKKIDELAKDYNKAARGDGVKQKKLDKKADTIIGKWKYIKTFVKKDMKLFERLQHHAVQEFEDLEAIYLEHKSIIEQLLNHDRDVKSVEEAVKVVEHV